MIILGFDQDHTPFWTEQQQRKGSEERKHILDLFGPAREYRTCPVFIPDVSGMSRTIKTEHTPSAQTDLPLPNPPSRRLSSSPRATDDFTKKRERGRSHWRRLASRLKARGLGFHIAFSSLLQRYPNRGPRPIYMVED